MKKRLLTISLFLIVLGCAAIPESENNNDFTNDEKKAVVEEDKNKVICKKVRVSGTRLPRKVCRTIAEEEALAEKSQKILQDEINRGRTREIQNEG